MRHTGLRGNDVNGAMERWFEKPLYDRRNAVMIYRKLRERIYAGRRHVVLDSGNNPSASVISQSRNVASKVGANNTFFAVEPLFVLDLECFVGGIDKLL
jgi:hypothetical protein